MVAIAGGALWAGGTVFIAFVVLIAIGLLWEWWRLVSKIAVDHVRRVVWMIGGIGYIGVACFVLIVWRNFFGNAAPVLSIIASVIATDIGAYFAGRTFGGPKIAPKISPSKTWSGLGGGMLAASAVQNAHAYFGSLQRIGNYWKHDVSPDAWTVIYLSMLGCGIAIVAQGGDFLESWMKRRAGVKDSSALIPGHGGLLDRVDGLLAVLFTVGLIALFVWLSGR